MDRERRFSEWGNMGICWLSCHVPSVSHDQNQSPPLASYIIAFVCCLITINGGLTFYDTTKQIKNCFNSMNIENRGMRAQLCRAAFRLFLDYRASLASFCFLACLHISFASTLHFAWRPSILQMLNSFWALFLYSKHHYTSGSWSHYYGRRKKLCVSNYLTLSEADCRPLSSDNRITA